MKIEIKIYFDSDQECLIAKMTHDQQPRFSGRQFVVNKPDESDIEKSKFAYSNLMDMVGQEIKKLIVPDEFSFKCKAELVAPSELEDFSDD